MSEKDLFHSFSKNMESMGLPAPDTLFKGVSTSLGTITALAAAVKTYGTTATVTEVFATIPLGASSTATAAGISEIAAVAGALAASFYVGACIGSLIIAVEEVYGDWMGSHIASALNALSADLGIPLHELITNTVKGYPIASPIRKAAVIAKPI